MEVYQSALQRSIGKQNKIHVKQNKSHGGKEPAASKHLLVLSAGENAYHVINCWKRFLLKEQKKMRNPRKVKNYGSMEESHPCNLTANIYFKYMTKSISMKVYFKYFSFYLITTNNYLKKLK